MFNKNYKNRKVSAPFWRWITCLLFITGLWTTGVKGQTNIANYSFTATTGNTYTDLGTNGTAYLTGAYDNSVSAAINIGGNFIFGGNTFTTCYISSNGFITFGAAPALANYTPMSTLGSTTGAIAGYGQDGRGTVAAGTEIRYYSTGTEFVVQYKNHHNYYNTTGERLNFQIRLTYATGAINIIYGTCTLTNTSTSGTPCQVGIRGNSVTFADNVNSLTTLNVPAGTACTWANAVNGNANNSTMWNAWVTNTSISIPNGLQYTWTPPAATLAPVRTFSAVSGITATGATINWTAPTGANQYNIQYRVPGTCAWTNWIGNPVLTNSVSLTGLSGLTSYQVRVQSSNGSNNAIYSHIPDQAGSGSGYSTTGTFTTLSSCPSPSSPTVTNVASSTADLAWTAALPVPSNGYQYAVTTSATPPASGTASAGTSVTGYTGLLQGTTYYLHVRSDCGGTFSSWVTSSSFTTLCNVITSFPYTENFDGVTLPALPSCWIANDVNADGDKWITYSGYSQSGTQSAGLYTDFNAGANNDYLILPPITLTGNQRLVYSYRARSSGEPNDYTVKLSTTGNAPANFTTTLLGLTTVNNTTYATNIINLNAYTGTVYIAFHVPAGGLDGYYLYIDDVMVENLPSCLPPTGLASSASPTSANLSWVAPGAGTPTGYNWEVRTSGVGGSGASGLTTSGSTTTPTVTATAGGLTPNTTYQLYVQTDCGGSGTSTWAGPFAFTTPCNAITSFPFTENFDGVTTPALPSCWSANDANADGDKWITYSGYSQSGTQSAGLYTDFNAGANNDYLILPPITLTGNQRLVYSYRVRSASEPNDYTVKLSTTGNAPANFTTTLLGLTTVNSTTYATNIINLNAYTGTVYIAFHVPAGGLDGYYLYIDDVIVENLPTCFSPTALSVTGAAPSVNLSWTAPTLGTPSSYDWEVRTSGAGGSGATGLAASGNTGTAVTSATASGLSGGTNYNLYVRTYCGGIDYSSWAGPYAFYSSPLAYNVVKANSIGFTSIQSTLGGGGSPIFTTGTSSNDDQLSDALLFSSFSPAFTFNYQGQAATQVKACTNGWLTLSTTNTSAAFTNNLGSVTATTNATLAPYWDDLRAFPISTSTTLARNTFEVQYKITGTSPNRELTIEWHCYSYGNTGPDVDMYFQCVLNESGGAKSNQVEFKYGNFSAWDGLNDFGYSYSCGMNGYIASTSQAGNVFALQSENTNIFSNANTGVSVSGAENLTATPLCYSSLSFIPDVAYGGGTALPSITNDNCSGAIALNLGTSTPVDYCSKYRSAGATSSGVALPVSISTTNPDDDVWFSFNISGLNKNVTVFVPGEGGYNPVVEVFSGSCGSLTSIGAINATGKGLRETLSLTNLPAGTYYIRVFDAGSGSGTTPTAGSTGFSSKGYFAIEAYETPTPPVNDDASGALALTVGNTCVNQFTGVSTAAATASSQTLCGTTNPDDDVWYKFNATATSIQVKVTGAGSFNPAIEIFDAGANPGTIATMSSVACVDVTGAGGIESATPTFTIGNTYYVRVYNSGLGASTGSFSICASQYIACPTLNSPTNAASVYYLNVNLSWASVAGATGYDVYLSTNQTDVTNAAPAALVSSNQAGTSYLAATLTQNATYYWNIVSRQGAVLSSGCTVLNFITNGIAPPANDEPCNAIPLTVSGTCNFVQYTNAGATDSGILPAPGCASYAGGDVWFTLTVPASGSVILDGQTGVILDGGMAAYTATACNGTYTLVECDDDDSNNGAMPFLSLTGLTPGSTLYIRFWEFGGNNNGTFSICAYNPACAGFSVVPSATGSCEGGTLSLTSTPTGGAAPITYAWTTTAANGFTSTQQNPQVTTNALGANDNGSYSVLATDNSGCTATLSTNVTINAVPILSTSGGGTACAGNGITLSVSNNAAGQGSGNTYAWTTDASIPFTSTQQTPSVTGSSVAGHSGNYTVVVTNSFLCTASAVEVVTVNPNPVLSIVSIQNVGCVNGSDGVITVSASNGTPVYNYSADGFATQNNSGVMTNLPTGPTTVQVSDDNGCTSSLTQSLTAISSVPPSASVIVPFTGMPTNVCPGTTATLSIAPVANATMYIWDAPGTAYFNGNPLNVSPFTTTTPSVTVTYGAPVGSLYSTGVQAANGCGQSVKKIQKTRGTVSVPASITGALTACENTNGNYSTGAVDAASSYLWTITGDATVSGTGTTATVSFGPAWNGGTLCVSAQTTCYTSPAKCITINKSAAALGAISGTFTACPNTTLNYSVPASAGAASYTWTLPPGATGASSTNSISVNYGAGYSAVGSICVSVTSICGVTSALKCKTVAPGLPSQPASISGELTGLCNQTKAYNCPSQGVGVTYNWTAPAGTIITGNGSTAITAQFGNLTTGNVCVTASSSCGSSAARCVPVKGAPNAPGAITATPSSWCANTPGIQFDVNVTGLSGAYTLNWTYPTTPIATYTLGGGNSTQLVMDWLTGTGNINVTASNACGSGTRTSTWSQSCRQGEVGTVGALTVSPNPTTGMVNINYTASKGNTVINVLDLAGRVVMTQTATSVDGANNTQLDMSKLAKGAYMLSVQSTQGNKQIKVVVE